MTQIEQEVREMVDLSMTVNKQLADLLIESFKTRTDAGTIVADIMRATEAGLESGSLDPVTTLRDEYTSHVKKTRRAYSNKVFNQMILLAAHSGLGIAFSAVIKQLPPDSSAPSAVNP